MLKACSWYVVLKPAIERIQIVVVFCLSIVSTDVTRKKKRVDSVSYTDKSVVYVDKSLLYANPGASFISTGQDVESHLYNYAFFFSILFKDNMAFKVASGFWG